jgi:UDP-glucose 4-epimerase
MVEWLHSNHPAIALVGLDNMSGATVEPQPYVKFYEIDIRDADAVNTLFAEHHFDVVYHFAATPQEVLSSFTRVHNYTNNLIGPVNLINASVNTHVKRYVFTSSIAAIGAGDGKLPFTEETPLCPVDPYGIAKMSVEHDLRTAYDKFGLEYCIVRPRNLIGFGQCVWDMYRNVLAIFMWQKLNSLPLTIYGDGEQKRAFSPVEDILLPLYNAGFSKKARNMTVNLGSSKPMTVNSLADTFESVCGEKLERVYLEKRHEVDECYCSTELSQSVLGYKENTDIRDCIAGMWTWAKTLPMRPRVCFDAIEIEQGLYSFWKK